MADNRHGQKSTPKRIGELERKRTALEMRKAGATYDQIADKLGLSTKAAAYNIVKRCLDDLVREPAEELLALELERLDSLYLSMYPAAKKGNQGAVDRCLRIMERRSSLLRLDDIANNDGTTPFDELNILEYDD